MGTWRPTTTAGRGDRRWVAALTAQRAFDSAVYSRCGVARGVGVGIGRVGNESGAVEEHIRAGEATSLCLVG